MPFASLTAGRHPFTADHPLMAKLPDKHSSIEITEKAVDTRELLLSIRWRQGKRTAQMTIVRVGTGGDNLW
ncbi:MAG TPA: hypothetical protein VNM92_09365 [Thermoanaerobaculia bacterium]|nr:hypothetical protein [Thermoanaerobaculia bacterium]